MNKIQFIILITSIYNMSLITAMDLTSTQTKQKIKSYRISSHCAHRMAQRKITKTRIAEVLKKGTQVQRKGAIAAIHTKNGKETRLIFNPKYRNLITVYNVKSKPHPTRTSLDQMSESFDWKKDRERKVTLDQKFKKIDMIKSEKNKQRLKKQKNFDISA